MGAKKIGGLGYPTSRATGTSYFPLYARSVTASDYYDFRIYRRLSVMIGVIAAKT